MKNFISLSFIIAISMMLSGCGGKTDRSNTDSSGDAKAEMSQDTTNLVISIPDMAIEKLIMLASAENCRASMDSLRVLRMYDNTLVRALAENDSIGDYLLTRKINPCCPCAGACCQCPRRLSFASPAGMRANMILTGSNQEGTPLKKELYARDGVEFFTVPSTIPDGNYTLEVTGNGITPPLIFDFNANEGKLDFK